MCPQEISGCVESKQGKGAEERVLGRTNLCEDSMVCTDPRGVA